jgi:hypothetical protein
MKGLKQSTVATVIVGPVLDSTGAAVTNAVVGDFRLAKNGTVATLSGATVTHDANGYYLIALTTGNTDTTGRLVLTSGNTAHSMASHHWSVLPASVFDAIYTNATNSTGGLATATGNITALAGAISTFAGGAVASVTGAVGSVTGSVGSISGVTFPANFSNLIITSSGAIGELGPSALAANSLNAEIAQAVWNSLTTATYTNQSFGDRILISNNNTREISVTGSGHAAAVLHDAEPNSIPEDAFVSGAVSARALAADAATEIATAVAATQALSRLDSMIEDNGAGQFRFDTIALEMAPAGGGGGNQTINVYPVSASTPERVQGTTLTFYRNESRSVSVVTDFTLTSLTLQFTVEDQDGVDVYTLANGSITRSSQTFTVAVTTAVTGNLGQYRWSMRDISGGGSSVIAMGVLTVQEAASNV